MREGDVGHVLIGAGLGLFGVCWLLAECVFVRWTIEDVAEGSGAWRGTFACLAWLAAGFLAAGAVLTMPPVG